MSVTTETTPTMTEPLLDNEVHDDDNNNTMESSSAVRKRTRATAEQLAVLEDTFAANVSPNSKLRKQLSERLQMSERSIQIWFQNRRAKVKHMQKRAQMQMQQASIRAQLYHYHQQQYMHHPQHPQPTYLAPGNPPIMPLPQHQQHHQQHHPIPMASQQQPFHQRIPLPTRSQSVDSNSLQYNHNPTPPASISSSSSSSTTHSTTSPSSSLDNIPSSSTTTTTTTLNNNHSSYPLQENVDFPDYLNGPLSPSASPHHDFQSVSLSHPLHNTTNEESTTTSMHDLNHPSTLPTLVSVPDAGPTAMLSTGSNDHLMSTPATTPPSMMDQPTISPQDIWPASLYHTNLMRSQSVAAIPMATSNSEFSSTHLERSLSNPPVTTIDPSNLMMNNANRLSTTPPVETTTTENNNKNETKSSNNNNNNNNKNELSTKEIYDVYLNCTTLTIGTWHRLKLRASDLLCVFKENAFEWHIEDAGCHFKMEISLSSVASIDFVEDNNGLADVHFDISESPLFYMETNNNNNNNNNNNTNDTTTSSSSSTTTTTWVQCSDFTEGKQASRFFRHSLKGVSQHLKQDLMTLMEKCPDARRWVRFLDPIPHPTMSLPPQHPTSHFSSAVATTSYPLTHFDPMLTGNQHPSQMSNPMTTMLTSPNTSSPSTYLPHVPPSYWSSMYSQAPMMMGVSNYLV
ncbi:unnamed protein product [Cunninghamella blakesleeana]